MAVTPRRALGVGAAGLTAALATAPLAHAAPSPTPAPSASAHRAAVTPAPAVTKTTGTSSSTSTAPLAPNYGVQKYRVGVQVKDGSYVPSGTSTAGTKVTAVETGPGVEAEIGKSSVTIPCTTVADTLQGTATYCEFDTAAARLRTTLRAEAHRMAPALTVRPTPSGIPQGEQMIALPGDTVTITQTTVRPNLVKDTSVAVLKPCEIDPGSEVPICGSVTGESPQITSTDLVFDDPGLPPTATNNTARTDENTSVSIVVTKDDNTHGAPVTGLSVASDPKHGAATVVPGSGAAVGPAPSSSAPSSAASSSSASQQVAVRAAAASPAAKVAAAKPAAAVVGTTIRYTPKAGFSGTDTFTYRLTDANGSATARVTVTVVPAPASASSSSAPLAETGTDSSDLGGLALTLLVAGGAATVLGRHRRHVARHASAE